MYLECSGTSSLFHYYMPMQNIMPMHNINFFCAGKCDLILKKNLMQVIFVSTDIGRAPIPPSSAKIEAFLPTPINFSLNYSGF